MPDAEKSPLMTKILFYCFRNDARSQMAEAFARARRLPGVLVASAGIEPSAIPPGAIRAMGEAGLDMAGQTAKRLQDLPALDFDIVIALCDEAAARLPLLPGRPLRVNWRLPDPAAVLGDDDTVRFAYQQARDTIRRLVDDFFDHGYCAALQATRRNEMQLLDTVSDGIIIHDLQRRIFHFNKAAEQITGYTREEVLNRDCHDVFAGNLCSGKCQFCDATPTAFAPQRELELTTKSGERRVVDMTVTPLIDDRQVAEGVFIVFHDRTIERRLARRVGEIQQFSGIIGRDAKMQEVYELIREVADSNVPVLIQGESGTGKELVAAAIHNESPRAGKLFVPVNCGALPETLLESELFGHVKGAFTGAIRDKKGRFELAHGGTIFLDEIGDISPAMQVRLLRVLQEGTFERVGSETTVKVDVRLISATNRQLADEIAEGRFREDLYYRLNVVPLFLPPLRERRTDIPLLTEHILKRALADMGRAPDSVTIGEDALDVLLAHDWPGNVRELQNWILFGLVKCRSGVMHAAHLPPQRQAAGQGQAAPHPRRHKLDLAAVRAALTQANDNRVEAARLLNVSRATLYRFLEKAGI